MKGKEAQSFEGELGRKDGEEAEERPNRLEIRPMQQFVFRTVGCTNLGQFQEVYEKLHEAVGLSTMCYTEIDAHWLSQQLQSIVPH